MGLLNPSEKSVPEIGSPLPNCAGTFFRPLWTYVPHRSWN